MRRSALVGTILLTAGLLVGGPAPAEASGTGLCAGTGTLVTSSPLRAPVGTPGGLMVAPRTTEYAFVITAGMCVGTWPVKSSFFGTGVITGYCGLWSGVGTIDGTHGHAHTLSGTSWLIRFGSSFNGALGGFTVVPDGTSGGSCASGTATVFTLVGSANLF